MQAAPPMPPFPTCPNSFTSEQEFNRFCQSLVDTGKSAARKVSILPAQEFQVRLKGLVCVPLGEKQGQYIRTDWGGVDISCYDEQTKEYEKYLLVEAGTWLALESHAAKLESLQVKEGHGYLIYQAKPGANFELLELQPGVERMLHPGQKHCIVADANLLVFESGVDPKGMDQDLIFDFMPDISYYRR
jgi:hypothetical protein